MYFPHDLDSDAKDLIDKLLDMVPDNRLGMRNSLTDGGYHDLRNHPYFADLDFKALEERTLRVPYQTLNTTTTTDSDELLSMKRSDEFQSKAKSTVLKHDDIRKYFDECCVYRARFLSRKYWEGEVKVRRKIFLTRIRYMILFEDGTCLLLRRGHIRAEFLID